MAEITQRLRQSAQVGSDETSVRVQGKTQWEWVFQNAAVCLHVIRASRGSKVITSVMADAQPAVWISDLFSAQSQHPAVTRQVCLAHQLRDVQYAIDAGDQIFAPVMQQLFRKAITWHQRWACLAASTQAQYRRQIQRELLSALQLEPTQADGMRLLRRYQKIPEQLFVFLSNPTVPTTNNASEQALRLSVIYRKVTNGFRSQWGRDLFAAVRSVVNTGYRLGLSALDAISIALDPTQSRFAPG